MASPVDGADIRIQAAARKLKENTLRVGFRIEAGDVLLESDEHTVAGHLDVVIAALGEDGHPTIMGVTPVPVQFPADQKAALLREGLLASGDYSLPEGAKRLRVIVRDTGSGFIGWITIELTR